MHASHPDSYLICATPRTGSTLLCDLLASTGIAGRPESYFRAQDLARRAARWDICSTDGSYAFGDYLEAAIAAGRTSNGVFAARIMWGTMAELVAGLRGDGEAGADREVLTRTFGATSFVYLYRRDTLAQAVSRARAEQTGLWHLTDGSRSVPSSGEVRYDREQIGAFLQEADEHNRAWQRWFRRNQIEPFELAYEDLAENPDRSVRGLLAYLGLRSPAREITAGNSRMADALNDQWIRRFREYAATRR